MAKVGRPAGKASAAQKGETRQRIIRAAFDTLRTDGFAGTSARAIAAKGGFDQALVFYYFGTVNDLLLAALAASSEQQLVKYETTLAGVTTLADLFGTVATQFEDDEASGHIKVLAELVGASADNREMAEAVGAMVDPWMALTERTMTRLLGDSGLGSLVPPDQIAFVVVALFLGIELLVNLKGDHAPVRALFQTGATLGGLFGALLGAPPGGAAS